MQTQLDDFVLRQTLTIAADAIICIDSEQRITFFNDGAVAIFGYASDEVLGKHLEMLYPERLHSVHRKHVAAFGQAPVAARSMGERREITGLRKDGTEFPAEAAIAHVQSADGTAFSVVLRDVTERRRIEAVNAQLVRDLQSAVSARDEMLAIVSHDLRNPVNAVKMLSAAILREVVGTDVGEDVREHAGTMGKAAEQMDALIQDLLDVSRIESGRLQLSPRAVPLPTLLQHALATLTPIAKEDGVTLHADVDPDLPPVDVDAARIVQVLSNLVGNGIKYTPRGGTVTVTATRDYDDVRVTVADTGVGISVDDLPRVFDRFWQVRRTNRSGAGLGLTIARGIVRGHGGRIWVESTAGAGTRVHFTLPVAVDPVTQSPQLPTHL
ncbi:MAG: ATP-binding protein [Gemmatimonadales bacterium]